MIFNEPVTHLTAAERAGLLRILQEADISFGNLKFSLNDLPEAQRPSHNFRAPREFRWDMARTCINPVGMANNHALDFGPEGLRQSLDALDKANITNAGAGTTLPEARAPGTTGVAGNKTSVALLSCLRHWSSAFRSTDPLAPSLAAIDPATVLTLRADGAVEAAEGPQAADVAAMEDDIVLARHRHDLLIVTIHNQDVSHHRFHGIQDTTAPNNRISSQRAIELPVRPGQSLRDRRDSREVMETVMVSMVLNGSALKRIQLLPVTIDDEGPLYGVPRLADTRRGEEIVELTRRLSAPYGTRLVRRRWYAEVDF